MDRIQEILIGGKNLKLISLEFDSNDLGVILKYCLEPQASLILTGEDHGEAGFLQSLRDQFRNIGIVLADEIDFRSRCKAIPLLKVELEVLENIDPINDQVFVFKYAIFFQIL